MEKDLPLKLDREIRKTVGFGATGGDHYRAGDRY